MPALIEPPRAKRSARVAGRLTPRQVEVLELLAQGLYYKEIGVALGISPATVRAHLHATYRKLQVKSRSRAVHKFYEEFRRRRA